MLIDTHNHIYSEKFDEDRDKVIQRALDSGVGEFYLPAIDSTYTERMLDVEQKYPEIMHLMMGLHPTSVTENYLEELEKVKTWLDRRSFAAVGEIGIDLYWDKTFLNQQQEAFSIQIDWAKEKKLPIVIHTRNSFLETFEVLENKNSADLFGIFHCFTGTIEDAKRAIDLGFALGIGGVVTFKNGKIDKFLDEIDLEHIVLETDAPYLAPVPYRGKRNEPAYIPLVVEKLSSIYQVSPKEIEEITTQNAKRIFK
ncbi:YchF/TatD family DNA exonuclease [Flavobacteriaceae bacterium Ap0902]|nr:YchF/TatD family DNA exonuclease [Flavobacteriaceae bacterium Ap0902]